MTLPRYGHLCELYNLFAYLKRYHNTEMVFDPSEPIIEHEMFLKENWSYCVYATGKATYLNLFHLMHLNKEEKVLSCVSLLTLIMQEMQSHVRQELVS